MRSRPLSCILAFCALSQLAQAAPMVGFSPDPKVALPGVSFEILLRGTGFDVTASGLTINNVTGGQEFNLQFDGSLLEILSVQIDPRWTFTTGNNPGSVDNAAGTLTGLAFGTIPATTDANFDIATIALKSLRVGEGEILITFGEIAAKVDNVPGSKILPAFDSASVSVVPEPSRWAMLFVGLGLVAWRLRMRARRALGHLAGPRGDVKFH